MEDPTLYHGTFDTTGCQSGSDADVTKVTGVNFKEEGTNPRGIANWEDRFEKLRLYKEMAMKARFDEERLRVANALRALEGEKE